MEEEIKETKIIQFLEYKEIIGGETNYNILGRAKTIDIKGGSHKLKISSEIENLLIFGGNRLLNIKSAIDTLDIFGGVSKIYVHNYGNSKVNKLNITGGKHEITIYSYVNELNIRGGEIIINCNFENSRINKIKTKGGIIDIFLNKNTDKAIKENIGGKFNIQKTEIIPEPFWYQDSISDSEIPIIIFSEKNAKDNCAICLGEFMKGEKVYFLPCIHCFHADCLREWNKKNKSCPTCKFELKFKLAKE